MATVEQGLATQIRNIQDKYGKPMEEWFTIIAASGLTKSASPTSTSSSPAGCGGPANGPVAGDA